MSTDNPLDLVLIREIDVPPALVWKAWTEPVHLVKWFTPAPWQTVACEIDLHPGGLFSATMRSPEGEEFPNIGCYLDIVPNHKLVWTNALQAGFRPAEPITKDHGGHFYFTATVTLEPTASGTRYIARVLHADEASRKKHEAMGFHDGWSAALDQLVAMVKAL